MSDTVPTHDQRDSLENRTPLVRPCEGSNLVGHPMSTGVLCQMCGNLFPSFPFPDMFDKVPEHDRLDILAMVERGDFG